MYINRTQKSKRLPTAGISDLIDFPYLFSYPYGLCLYMSNSTELLYRKESTKVVRSLEGHTKKEAIIYIIVIFCFFSPFIHIHEKNQGLMYHDKLR